MDRLTLLGTAYAIANQFQENTHLLLQTGNHIVLIDCGNNPVGKLQKINVSINDVTDLILTHAHADHMGALPLLLMDMWLRKREMPLKIYGLPFTLEKANALLDVFSWQNWQGMFPVEFCAVEDASIQTIISADDLEVSVIPVKHLIPTLGVRAEFKSSQKVFVYSCDSETCENLDKLAYGGDLLIQEAAGPGKGHTSPEEAGITAKKAGVRQLVLIHYNASQTEAELTSAAKKNFDGDVVVAKDLMFFE